jgi:RNA polymerase sigma factor (sigma-70 family)
VLTHGAASRAAGRIIRPVHATNDEDATDEQLMLAYAAGDAASFARLFARHERPVHRFLLRSLGTQGACADDLLQEVWLAVVRNAAGYEARARFTTWLYGIARSRLIDHWRARGHPARSADSLDDPAANDGDVSWVEQVAADRTVEPEVRVLSRAHAAALIAAVEQLPAAQREVFLLHAEAEMTLEEIAQMTGVGMETAKSRLRYAMSKLRSALEQWR